MSVPHLDVVYVEHEIELMTDVELIRAFPALIERAGRTCYKSTDKITSESSDRFCRMLRRRGHLSVFEHGSFTVRIVTDRSTAQQITRHRLCSYSMESQRYCAYNNELHVIIPDILRICPEPVMTEWEDCIDNAAQVYAYLLNTGVAPEDARSVLPNCTATEIIMTTNIREWRWVFQERACNRHAQSSIRMLFSTLLKQLTELAPCLFDDLQPYTADLAARGEHMEKYGVQIDDSQQKTAEKTNKPTCPKCGSVVDMSGNVPKCPKCGTEPFEKR